MIKVDTRVEVQQLNDGTFQADYLIPADSPERADDHTRATAGGIPWRFIKFCSDMEQAQSETAHSILKSRLRRAA